MASLVPNQNRYLNNILMNILNWIDSFKLDRHLTQILLLCPPESHALHTMHLAEIKTVHLRESSFITVSGRLDLPA